VLQRVAECSRVLQSVAERFAAADIFLFSMSYVQKRPVSYVKETYVIRKRDAKETFVMCVEKTLSTPVFSTHMTNVSFAFLLHMT